MELLIRRIEKSDNAALAGIIRTVLTEFGSNKPGTAYYDESTDHLSEQFLLAKSAYFTALADGKVIGGAGIFPTAGLPDACCELVKMYLDPTYRGKGIGRLLIEQCLTAAGEFGYRQVYLETMPALQKAIKMYEQYGFQYLPGALGHTGHFACGIWMLKDL